MKKLSILFALLFISVFTFAQTTVKTFDPAGASLIKLDFKTKQADDKKWDNETIRIQMEIHTNMPETIMKQLVKAGRYNLSGKRIGDQFVITAPNINKNITVGGVTLDDQVHVHVERPVWMVLGNGTLTAVGRGVSKAIRSQITVAEVSFVYTNKTANNNIKSKIDKANNKKKPKRNFGAAGSAPAGTLNEMKAQFGEILIDGVVWEVE